ncbi:MAG: tRNA (guanosine(46)-N7)-methyltransferase TrmB [Clostridiales bacterium]|jgi:tRNA (guanine-N7-)-methyltransferase|nr:tRNA (guanosine(46)-N7)-methyltransferase TrmB [Clostridiales bacterium]
MRNRKKPWAGRELAENPMLAREPEKGFVRRRFGNDNPVYLEIGCGKGRFITKKAAAAPEANFIGLEKERIIIASALREASGAGGPRNLCFILGEAEALGGMFGEGEISRIYLNFSDPWRERKKWEKRRLTHMNFLEIYKRILARDGEIFFKTDNRRLFDFSVEQLEKAGFRLAGATYDLHGGGVAEDALLTEYEERFVGLGVPICALSAKL